MFYVSLYSVMYSTLPWYSNGNALVVPLSIVQTASPLDETHSGPTPPIQSLHSNACFIRLLS